MLPIEKLYMCMLRTVIQGSELHRRKVESKLRPLWKPLLRLPCRDVCVVPVTASVKSFDLNGAFYKPFLKTKCIVIMNKQFVKNLDCVQFTCHIFIDEKFSLRTSYFQCSHLSNPTNMQLRADQW